MIVLLFIERGAHTGGDAFVLAVMREVLSTPGIRLLVHGEDTVLGRVVEREARAAGVRTLAFHASGMVTDSLRGMNRWDRRWTRPQGGAPAVLWAAWHLHRDRVMTLWCVKHASEAGGLCAAGICVKGKPTEALLQTRMRLAGHRVPFDERRP